MNIQTKPNFAKLSPIEKRQAKKSDFVCECGEEWMTPGHMFWLCRMQCPQCGEGVEAR